MQSSNLVQLHSETILRMTPQHWMAISESRSLGVPGTREISLPLEASWYYFGTINKVIHITIVIRKSKNSFREWHILSGTQLMYKCKNTDSFIMYRDVLIGIKDEEAWHFELRYRL